MAAYSLPDDVKIYVYIVLQAEWDESPAITWGSFNQSSNRKLLPTNTFSVSTEKTPGSDEDSLVCVSSDLIVHHHTVYQTLGQ